MNITNTKNHNNKYMKHQETKKKIATEFELMTSN